MKQTRSLRIEVEVERGVKAIKRVDEKLKLDFLDGKVPSRTFDKVIVATGGSPKRKGLEWLEKLNHKIEDPVPSLFTFNMPGGSITELMGIVVEKTLLNIQGTKIKSIILYLLKQVE